MQKSKTIDIIKMKDCIFQLEMCFLSIKISDKLVALEMENIESVEKGQIDKVTNH